MNVEIKLPRGARFGETPEDVAVLRNSGEPLKLDGEVGLAQERRYKIRSNGGESAVTAFYHIEIPVVTVLLEFVIQSEVHYLAVQQHGDRWMMSDRTLVVEKWAMSADDEDTALWREVAPLALVYLAEANGRGWFRREV